MMLANRAFNLFDEMIKDPFFSHGFDFNNSSVMKTDVLEKDGCYMVDIELPGYSKEDVKAELNDGYLTISANHNETNDEKDSNGNYIRRERYTGTCQRSFYVGDNVTEADIQAAFKDGILRLSFPKEKGITANQPKLIDIK